LPDDGQRSLRGDRDAARCTVQASCGRRRRRRLTTHRGTPNGATRKSDKAKPVALVILLRGVNVGGSRTFRPSALAAQLQHLDAVNIGAAGTLVIRKTLSQAQARAEVARRLPFETDIVVCPGRDIARLASVDHFPEEPAQGDLVRFVSVLTQRPRLEPTTPVQMPDSGPWLLKIVARQGRYVLGMYRRHPKVIGYLGALDRLYGVPVTTRNWNTVGAIVQVLRR
jgi:uncharacterized protein (DUF1697 family)